MPLVVSHPATEDFVNDLNVRFTKAGRLTLREAVAEIKSEMSVEGAPRQHTIITGVDKDGKVTTFTYGDKVQWDSERQRKAYFATDGFGQGIPYVRKGNYIRGWTVTQLANGYSLSNKHPAGAIGGTINNLDTLKGPFEGIGNAKSWRSRIHRNRWNRLVDAAARAVLKITKNVLDRMKVTTKND